MGFMEHIDVTEVKMPQDNMKNPYLLPWYTDYDGKPCIDLGVIDAQRDQGRRGFTKDELEVVRRMERDAEKKFGKDLYKMPSYKNAKQHEGTGLLSGILNDYMALLGINEREALERFCIRQKDVGEQGDEGREP